MKIFRILIVAIVLLSVLPAEAQKKKAQTEKPKTEKPQPSAGDLLFENMLESTQRVFIIDSVVTDKSNFINEIPLPPECGTLTTYDQFFNTQGNDGNYVFVNEFGNKAYYSLNDGNGNSQLYTMDRLGEEWSKPARVEGITGGTSANYPFMMADGTTFYFAQKGENSVGGYDIFVTRYDSDTGEFLRPNNVGLPFNSKANDFFYMESELDSLGWFVTDRNQPEGKVCVYTFVPSKNRTNIDLAESSESQVRNYAAIQSIRDTWPSEKAHEAALNRVERMKARSASAMKNRNTGNAFVINDRVVYKSASEFRSEEARGLYNELLRSRQQAQRDARNLDALRNKYADGEEQLASDILSAERQQETLLLNIKKMEKQIRILENHTLSN
ncbi:MAG: hypothetical protein K5893_12985 [Prevotella sp.]|nr:hypothetical protein [Prevotella sp.]